MDSDYKSGSIFYASGSRQQAVVLLGLPHRAAAESANGIKSLLLFQGFDNRGIHAGSTVVVFHYQLLPYSGIFQLFRVFHEVY